MSRSGASSKVYVGDLGSGGSKPELEREFEKYGALKSVWVARNPPGFAFIEFEDPRDAEDSVRDMDGREVCGVRIRVELAKSTGRSNRRRDFGGSSYRPRSRSPGPRYDKRSRSPAERRRSSRSPPRRRYRSPESPYRRDRRDY